MEWEVDYNDVTHVTYTQAWNYAWFIRNQGFNTITASTAQSAVGKTFNVGIISIVRGFLSRTGKGTNYGLFAPSADSETEAGAWGSDATLTLKCTTINPDEINSNDFWLFGTQKRRLVSKALHPAEGLGDADASATRFVLYFTRCCRATNLEELTFARNGSRNAYTSWIDKSKRRYSLQTKVFPREYVIHKNEVTTATSKWILPAVNREDPTHPLGIYITVSSSGNSDSAIRAGNALSGLLFNRALSSGKYQIGTTDNESTTYDHRVGYTPNYASSNSTAKYRINNTGLVNWFPIAGATYRSTTVCSILNNASYCAYAVNLTVEDRALFLTQPSGGTTIDTRVGTQLDFVYVVLPDCNLNPSQIKCPPKFEPAEMDIQLIPTVPRTIRYRASIDSGAVKIVNDPEPVGITIKQQATTATSNPPSNPAYVDITFDVEIDGPKGGIVCLKATAVNTSRTSIGLFCPRFTVVQVEYMFLSGIMRQFSNSEIAAETPLGTTVNISPTLNSVTRKIEATSGTNMALFNSWWSDSAPSTLHTLTLTRYYNDAMDRYALTNINRDANGQPTTPVNMQPYWKRIFTSLRPFWTNPSPATYQTYELHTTMDLLDTETLRFGVTGGELFVYMNNTLVVELSYMSTISSILSPSRPTGATADAWREPVPRMEDFLTPATGRTGATGWVKTLTSTQIRAAVNQPTLPVVGKDSATTFALDIFYTQRGPSPGFFLEMANSTACSPLAILRSERWAHIAKAAEVFNYVPGTWDMTKFTTLNSNTKLNAAGELQLLPSTATSTGTAVWTTNKLKVLSGYEVSFTFKQTPITLNAPSTGLAFVVQDSSPSARGSDSQGLAYDGLTNAIAIEFDAYQDAPGDPASQHISVHKPTSSGVTYSAESTTNNPIGSPPVFDVVGLPFKWNNSTDHRIRILMTPTTSNWWLYVYVNDVIKPLYTASFSISDMKKWFPNGAYVGFVTTNPEFGPSTTVISKFSAVVIPPLAQYSIPVADTNYHSVAGSPLEITVQLCDACGTPLIVEGEAAKFSARFIHKWSQQTSNGGISTEPIDIITPIVRDSGGGKYTFSTTPLRAGEYVLHMYYQEVNQLPGQGQPIGAPYLTAGETMFVTVKTDYTGYIINAAPSTSRSLYLFGDMPLNLNNTADQNFFTGSTGVACYPTAGDGNLLKQSDKRLGRHFTTLAEYRAWLTNTSTPAWSTQTYPLAQFILCVNKAPYTGGVKSIIDSALTTGVTLPTNTQSISANWVLKKRNGSDDFDPHLFQFSAVKQLNSIFKVDQDPSDSFSFAFTAVMESAPPQWTNKVSNGVGMILLHTNRLVRPTNTESNYHFYARDLYGNPILIPGPDVYTVVSIPSLPDIYVADGQSTPGQPFWSVSFKTGTPGNHLLSLYNMLIPIADSGTLTVSAGAAHFSTSTQSGVTSSGAIDTLMSFRVRLYDATAFPITEQQQKAEITAIEWVSTTDSTYVPQSWLQDPLQTSSSAPSDQPRHYWGPNNSEEYLVEYTPTFAGSYFVKIYINSVCTATWLAIDGKDCRKNPAFELQASKGLIVAITPGPISTKSVVSQTYDIYQYSFLESDSTFKYQAGEAYTYYINTKDHYGNDRYTPDSTGKLLFSLYSDNTFTTQFTAAQFAAAVVVPATHSLASLEAEYDQDGQYHITIIFKQAVTVYIRIELDRNTTAPFGAGTISASQPTQQHPGPLIAQVTKTVTPGQLAELSTFAMWDNTNNVIFPSAKYDATAESGPEATTDNVFFVISPRDVFNNAIPVPNLATAQILKNSINLQYTTTEFSYSFGFIFEAVKSYKIGSVDAFICGFKRQVAGLYSITPVLAGSGDSLSIQSGHNQFRILAGIPNVPKIQEHVNWPIGPEPGQELSITFPDVDRWSNMRSVDTPLYTFSLYITPLVIDNSCSDAQLDAPIICQPTPVPSPNPQNLPGGRPEFTCTVPNPPPGNRRYHIVPNTPTGQRLPGCERICNLTEETAANTCTLSQIIATDADTSTNAYIQSARYFDTEPTDLNTSVQAVDFVTFDGTTNTVTNVKFNLNENQPNGGTSADKYILFYVIEPSAFETGEIRQLTLESSTPGFTTLRATSKPCSSSNNQNIVSACSRWTPAQAVRVYIFKARLTLVANYSFLIKFGKISSIHGSGPTLYSLNIVPGALSATNSQYLSVLPTEAEAGKGFVMSFYPKDSYNNNISTLEQWTDSATGYKYAYYRHADGITTTTHTNVQTTICSFIAPVGPTLARVDCPIPDPNTVFITARLEVFFIYANRITAPASIVTTSTENNFIQRSMRTIRITPGPAYLPEMTLSLMPTAVTFSTSLGVAANTPVTWYLIVRDRYRNPTALAPAQTAAITGVKIVFGTITNNRVKDQNDWVLYSSTTTAVIYSQTATLTAVSRYDAAIFASDGTLNTPSGLIRVRSADPVIDTGSGVTRSTTIYDIGSNWTTISTLSGLSVDSRDKSYHLKILDINGMDYVKTFPSITTPYPSDTNLLAAEITTTTTQNVKVTLPVTITQIRTIPTNPNNSPVVDGRFVLSIPAFSIQGIYTLRISAIINGIRQDILVSTFPVAPGLPKIDYTTIVSRSSPFVTGASGEIQFKLYDRYSNPIQLHNIFSTPLNHNPLVTPLTPNTIPTGSGTLIPSFHTGSPSCSQDIHDFSQFHRNNLFYAAPRVTTTSFPRFGFESVSFNSTSGAYTAKFTPAPTGTYTFNLTYVTNVGTLSQPHFVADQDDHVFSCNSMAPFIFNVETGAPHYTRSYYNVTRVQRSEIRRGSDGILAGYAGQTYQVDLYLLDVDGNSSKADTDSWLFWSNTGAGMNIQNDLYHDPSARFDPITNELLPEDYAKSNLLYLKKEVLTEVVGFGHHRWTFRPRVANGIPTSFNFKISMKDQLTGAWDTVIGINSQDPYNSKLIQKFSVLHGVPARVVPYALPSSPIAGEPFEFSVSAQDGYGNPITTNDLSKLTVKVTRTGSSMDDPLVYIDSLQWTLQPSQITTTQEPGTSSISFDPSWEGEYSIEIVMRSIDGLTYYASQTIPDYNNLDQFPIIRVSHATCAGRWLASNPTGDLITAPLVFCQSSGDCVDAVTSCPKPSDQIQCTSGQRLTSTGCVGLPIWTPDPNDPTHTPLPGDYKICDTDGSYVLATQPCPMPTSCPSGTIKCTGTSICRASSLLCPSPTACPPGLMVCPNNLSCATTLSNCPTIPQATINDCSDGVLCNSGSCVASAGECPTAPTCALGQVLCLTDGSCRANPTACPSLPPAQIQTPQTCQENLGSTTAILCSDGRTCAKTTQNCPSSITCPIGSALCAVDNSCQSTSCPVIPTSGDDVYPDPSSPTCAATEFRCSTGNCVQNLLLCPSKPTCSTHSPVLCSDLTCKSSLALCTQPKSCTIQGLLQCISTGSCVPDLKYCSAPKTCPITKPVLCSGGDCSDTIENCPEPLECPPALPFLCPSGNCRASISDCPSLIGCPPTVPLRCDDNSCVVSPDLCKSKTELIDSVTQLPIPNDSITKCPEPLIKCPTGECSSALLTCSSHITCPSGTTRCPSGLCLATCPTDITTGSPTDLPTCASRSLITCPISGQGYSCAKTLAECPQGVTCPLFQPVKCAYGSTCAISVDDCPPVPTVSPPGTKFPCFDGSWVFGTQTDCPTAVTCTPNAPIKCSDQTCKATIDECAVPLPCNDDSTPYRCTNGLCSAAPWDCTAVLDGGIVCPSQSPIKCPIYQGITQCVSDLKSCQVYRNPDGTKSNTGGDPNIPVEEEEEDTDPYLSPCAPGFTYCRDGSCQESPSSCPIFTCGVAFPYLCSDGACAQSADKCTNIATGCPWDKPNRCPGTGNCVSNLSSCPRDTCAQSNPLSNPCIDGTCKEVCTLAANGCPVSASRCNDGTCVLDAVLCSSQGNDGYANSCPPGMPLRCGNGFCAEKQSQCVVLSTDGLVNCPVLCADGSCEDSTELCPLVKPCTGDNIRCGDGSCRLPENCPNWNSCQNGQTRCLQSNFSFPILDGLCSQNGQCLSQNGCPITNGVEQHRCSQNGRCVIDETLCTINLPLTNGCTSDFPTKCWDSSCAKRSGECPQTNGCPWDKPTRCNNGDCISKSDTCSSEQLAVCSSDKIICADGSCVLTISQCKTSFGCPIDKPVRCYNGDCRAFSSRYRSPIYGLSNEQINTLTCPPVISCPSSAYTMCADSSCVLSPSLCPSTDYTCAATEFRCLDGSCRPSSVLCGFDPALDPDGTPTGEWSPSSSKPAFCPPTLPVLCPNSGQCVPDQTSCNNNADVETTIITGSSAAPIRDTNKPFQTQCFDGSWVDSYAQCRKMGQDLNEQVNSGSPVPGTVPICVDYCSNGQCIMENQNPKMICNLIPACPVGKSRCFDGSCLDSCADIATIDCSAQLGDGYDPTQHIPNIDGICRSREESIGYRGCSSEPRERFHCSNRECSKDEVDCSVVANITSADDDAKIKHEDSPFAIRLRLEALRKAAQHSVTLQPLSLLNVPNSIIATFITQQTTEEEPSRSCTKNCVAAQSAYPSSIVYSPSSSQQVYYIAPASTGANIQLYSGLTIDPTEDLTLSVHPVGHNVYFNATNKLTYSRLEDFGGVEAFTAAQTVLSPVFSCSVGSGIVEPFNIGLKFTSLIDRSMTPTPQPTDICIARLRRFPQHNYQVWMCEFTEEQRRSGDLQYSTRQSPEQPLRQAISFISRCSDPDFQQVSSSIATESSAMQISQQEQQPQQSVPAIYAFIHSPLFSHQVYLPPKDTFWRDNVIWLLFVIIGGLLLLFVLAYALMRLSRYSKKTDKIKKEIGETEKEVVEMEQFGDKRRDIEVAYVANPLARNVQREHELLETNEEGLANKQAKLHEAQDAAQERREVIDSLEAENEAALSYLETLKQKQIKSKIV